MIVIIIEGGFGGGAFLTIAAIAGGIYTSLFGWNQLFQSGGSNPVFMLVIGYILTNALAAAIAPRRTVSLITTAITIIACGIPVALLLLEGADVHFGWYIAGSVLFLLMAAIPVAISTLVNYVICKIRGGILV